MDEYLRDWYNIKQELKRLEAFDAEYKRLMNDYMNQHDVNFVITSDEDIIVLRETASRDFLQKSEIPRDVWNRYKTTTTFNKFTVRRI